MANQNKKLSVKDGKKFMRQAFELEQNVLGSKLELSSKSVTHDATMGEDICLKDIQLIQV